MLATLRKIVSEQLENQAVVIRRTFIEVVDLRRNDQTPRRRYFSDSAVLTSPYCDIDCKSDDCSTQGEDVPVGERGVDSDFSDMEGIPSLPSGLGTACENDKKCGGILPDDTPLGGFVDPTVDLVEGYPAAGSDDEEDTAAGVAEVDGAACCDGRGYFDVFGFADQCSNTPRSSEGDDELSWRHLRTISFSEADDEAAPPLSPSESITSPSLQMPGLLPPRAAPPLPEMEARQPAQPAPRPLQFLAYLVPAPLGPCSAAAAGRGAGAAGQAAGAARPSPPPAAQERAEAASAEGAPQRPCAREAQRRRTTVMLRNIPNNYTRERFLALLDRVGLAGLYDFAYLPLDFRTGSSLGYAFLNLVDANAAELAWHVLDGFNRWATPSRKRCSVSWNDPHQGFEENVERYRDSPVMHHSVPDQCKPILFSNGVRIPYPAPTKAIRAPRLKKFG